MPTIKGGAALPVKASTSRPTLGPAIRVTIVSAGSRPVEGGAALPVRVITDADLRQNGGKYVLSGDVPIPVRAVTGRPTKGGPVQAVYIVGGGTIT